MEIVRDSDAKVEIHVEMTRDELAKLVSDMRSGCTGSNPYDVTAEFLNYLRTL